MVAEEKNVRGGGILRRSVVIFFLDEILNGSGGCAHVGIAGERHLYKITQTTLPSHELRQIFVGLKHGVADNQILNRCPLEF